MLITPEFADIHNKLKSEIIAVLALSLFELVYFIIYLRWENDLSTSDSLYAFTLSLIAVFAIGPAVVAAITTAHRVEDSVCSIAL